MGEVINLHCETVLDIPVETILKAALDASLESVILIGRTESGDEYYASSTGYLPDALWMIEKFKKNILEHGE